MSPNPLFDEGPYPVLSLVVVVVVLQDSPSPVIPSASKERDLPFLLDPNTRYDYQTLPL